MIPARFKVIVTRRPKCPPAATAMARVAQAPAPEHLIEAGIPTEALIAAVVIAKYADHLPLYPRGSDLWPPGRRTRPLDAGRLVGARRLRASACLRAIVRRLEGVRTSSSPTRRAPVLDPGRRKTKTGQLCQAYARDDRPWGGPRAAGRRLCLRARPQARASPPRIWPASLDASRSMATEKPPTKRWPRATRGYAGFLLGARAARNFFDIQAANPAPIAVEALARIGGLYAIERDIRGLGGFGAAGRTTQARARPILEAMKPWLEAKLAAVSGKSKLAEAIRYALSRWAGLTRYLDDWRIEIDNNVVERAMRPIALGRKNHLFAGSDEGGRYWAIHASLIETCKMNDVDPQAWLADVLDKIANRHPMSKIDEESCCRGPTSTMAQSAKRPENTAYECPYRELPKSLARGRGDTRVFRLKSRASARNPSPSERNSLAFGSLARRWPRQPGPLGLLLVETIDAGKSRIDLTKSKITAINSY